MPDTIWVAIVTGLLSAAGTIVTTILINKQKDKERKDETANRLDKLETKLDNFIQAVDLKFDSLGAKVDEHNGYAQKFTEVALAFKDTNKNIELMQKDIMYLRRGERG